MASPEPPFTIEAQSQGDRFKIDVAGEITYDSGQRLRDFVMKSLTLPARAFVLDLARVPFVDTAGIGILIGLKSSCQSRHKRLILKDLQLPVLQAFATMRLDQIFTLEMTKLPG